MRIPSRVLDIELPPFNPLNVRAAALRAVGTSRHLARAGTALLSTARIRPSRRRASAARPPGRALVLDRPWPPVAAASARRASGPARRHRVRFRGPGYHRRRQSRLRDRVDHPRESRRGSRASLRPTSPITTWQVRASGAVAIEAPLADQKTYCLTWDDLAPALTPRTRAVVLCNPSNPTGAPVDRGARRAHRAGAR